MQKQVNKEVSKAKLLAQMAMTNSGGDKTSERNVSTIWKEYLRAMYYLDSEHEDLEKNMQQEYNKFKNLRPTMSIQKDGSIKVTGLPTSVL